jgi:alpha-galactosidase
MILHLRNGSVSVVLDARGDGLPSVAHWGAPLGPLSQAELESLARAVVRPRPHSVPTVDIPRSLLPEQRTGYQGRPGLRGHRAGADWVTRFRLTDLAHDDTTVTITASDNGLRLRTELELAPSGVLRVRHRLTNTAAEPYTVDGLEVALPVPEQADELLDLNGRWSRERHPQRRAFDHGAWVRENRRGRTGHDATLALLAGTAGFGFRHGEVWGLHVAWSGNHVSYADRQLEGLATLGGGELLDGGEIILGAGEEYATPWVYAVYSDRGIDGVSAAFHGWLRARPHHPRSPRPVVLNTWEAVYFDHDLDRLRGLADVAARVGVERFVLDDGWFSHRRDDTAGLGDWYVDDGVWPAGLTPLIEHVTGLGMRFGLWVEPEMINPDSDLFRAHPDWVLRPADGELPPIARHQQVLDLAAPGAYAYVLERLDELLRDNDIRFLKWDHNRDLIAAGHAGRAGVHAQTTAVYRLLAELRSRHPDVEIESCSSGGARVDLGILEHTDRVWASDCNDALERQTIQRWTALLLPPELIGAHVGPRTSHTTGRTHDLSFRAATALFGHFGIEWDITTASPSELDGLTATIALYREMRDVLHTGAVVRVDHPDPAVLVHGVVSADRALFCVAQLTTSERAVPCRVRLAGLDPDVRYLVEPVAPAGEPLVVQYSGPLWMSGVELSGLVLQSVGLQLPILAPEQALLVRLTAV